MKRYYGDDAPRSTGPHPDPLADEWLRIAMADDPNDPCNIRCPSCGCRSVFEGCWCFAPQEPGK